MTRRFTGWHMLAILLGMFGVIVAVNFTMARYAVATFGGTVVDNSYVASQRYNRWLAEARAQKALGWSIDVSVDAARHVEIVPHAIPLADASVTAVAVHPLGRAADQPLAFALEKGRFRSAAVLPAGRWILHVEVRASGHSARFDDSVPA